MQEENLSNWLKLDDMNFYCSAPFYGVNIIKVNSIAYMDKKPLFENTACHSALKSNS